MTCYYCNNIEQLKNEYKKFIVNQKRKKIQILRYNRSYNGQKNNKKSMRYLFIKIKFSNNKKIVILNAMIKNEAIRNFMSQLKIKKLNFSFFIEINI